LYICFTYSFTFTWPCIVTCDRASWQILIKTPNRCTNFSNLFWNETLHVSDSSSVHYQDLFTVHTAGSRQNSISILILLESCLQTCMPYTIAECTVSNSWWLIVEVSETCRISFQNKFEKLVNLDGFIMRIHFTCVN
jgi:hypothetical protein